MIIEWMVFQGTTLQSLFIAGSNNLRDRADRFSFAQRTICSWNMRIYRVPLLRLIFSLHSDTRMSLCTEEATFGEAVTNDLKKSILQAAMPFVSKYGWSTKAVAAGLEKLNLSAAAANIFESPSAELVLYFHRMCNMNLQTLLKHMQKTMAEQPNELFLQTALEARLEMLKPYRRLWAEALQQLISPTKAAEALAITFSMCDDILYYMGDHSLDFSWYTKRASLLILYNSAELYMLQDHSDDISDTKAFLKRRLDDLRFCKESLDKIEQKFSMSRQLFKFGNDIVRQELRNIYPDHHFLLLYLTAFVLSIGIAMDEVISDAAAPELSEVDETLSTGSELSVDLNLNSNSGNVPCYLSLLQNVVLEGKTVESDEFNGKEAIQEKMITILVSYCGQKHEISMPASSTLSQFKEKVEALTDVPPELQKLTSKPLMMDSEMTLESCGVTNGTKCLLIGNKREEIEQIKSLTAENVVIKEVASKQAPVPLCQQEMHKSVLAKGKPNSAMIGIRNVQDPLPPFPIVGMTTKGGALARMVFKLELDQVWITTKERTNKIPMNQIRNIVNEKIDGYEEYHIMGLQLGTTENSRIWLYWVPAQFVEAIRNAILGP
ncbi:Ubiquitin domain-containing protein UBFD1 [Trichinella papuae]|uniref:Ubiquitin domain-containing protein UBFD1 n=1 Tax=Trichinella papuae TaxID=268474 RepID=A0A0V1N5W2_9BILA|nr:Ubiquitin domain-containing protein UBFD1 [Trichinella papuae]